jgi:hypothetical protein
VTGGSYSDHEALASALARYEAAERIATLLGRDIEQIADKAYLEMTRIAALCGYSMRNSNETAHDFAKRRVACFCRVTAR